MSTITLPNIRVSSDLTIRLKLKDGGVAIDWSTLQNIRVSLYADDQRSMASRCNVSIDEEDSTILVCQYAANKMQYLGVNRVIVQCKYMGEVKTYDKPAFNFVRWTSDQEGEQITIDDPDVDVEISVEDISSSILQEAVDAAFDAADRANDAAAAAEHMVDIHTGPEGKSAYEVAVEEGYTGTEEEWLASLEGPVGATPDISIGTVTTVEPGTPAAASMTGTPEAPVLNLSIPKGLVGATPNFTVGTVTTGEPGSSVIVTITGTPEAPVLNLTIPQGMQGNTGSSVDYPYELVNNLTTNDATKGLSAAQGYVLDGKVSQLEAKLNDRLPIIEEDGFAVADGEGNAVVRYDANGFDVAVLSSHLIELIKGAVDVNIINVEEDGFFVADGNYNVAASVSDSGLDAAGLATNLANIILALVGSPSYKVSCDVGFLPYFGLWNQSSEDSLCLCALKTSIVDDKIPFHEGFLFHKLPNDDKSFWFGTRLDNAVRIGTANFYPKDYLLAMSPTDGRVIAAKRWTRDNLQIWDGTNTTSVAAVSSDGNNRKPMGWLYNSGVDFILENGTEYCIFAEYDGGPTAQGGYYVWKGRYPYTQASDWKTTFHQDLQYSGTIQDGTITHFHMVRRDPWTNILYLTAGDYPGQLKWWYSTDSGETWVELTNNNTNGWEEHCCRLINFIFTEDYIYWATDHGTNHTLNRIRRNVSTGIIDISTREKLCDLPFAQACNSLCLVESPHGILMYERFDVGDEYAPYFDGKVKILFWSLTENRLYTIAELRLQEGETWGGCRGKCYVNYTSGQESRPAMGYADNTRCSFDLVGAGDNIGTIMFNL